MALREFPGSPVVRTQSCHCHGLCSRVQSLFQGTKIPHAVGRGQKKKKSEFKDVLGNKRIFIYFFKFFL